MKIVDVIKQRDKPILSFEIIPPKRGDNIQDIFKVVDSLMEFSPSFINVTKHANEVEYLETGAKVVKLIVNKRPGTVGISAALKNRYKVDVVPHLLCVGFNKYQLEDILIDLNYLGIENVFIIRGDRNKYNFEDPNEYKYASFLVKQISDLNKGIYVSPTKNNHFTDFCIGVAGYPEKHFESPNLEKDLEYLKLKIDLGAEFIITQMFFDVAYYKNFVDKIRKLGIDAPVIPGLKPVVSKKSLYNIPKSFFINIPKELVEEFDDAKTPRDEFNVGVKHTINMIEELLVEGVPGIHIFTMGKGEAVKSVLKEFQNVF
ncbi:MAG TPA: methylenetetrahydrofolate reductase [Defluviitoga sp.]|nr:methylenetetrahydrofolate reductase [Defluviitoga sp.]HOP24661.1 methylenetetrahydrofolate reductase [Defluviitoga sp.]HPZ28836.1 methylenetetrahydrofolate reductase [Defluviitoga sp.]HQD63224.1 methylenetetrahydrofolate reductase [Defluviitoga sp.]